MQARRGVAILGSTGSIGRSALAVLDRHRDAFEVVALVAGSNGDRLAEQVAEWRPRFAGLVRDNGRSEFCVGPEVLLEAATHPDAAIVINAVVGAAGLEATIAALRAGKRVALANKESLVMAGPLIAAAAAEGGGEVIPVDSEHSSVLQCLGDGACPPARLTLTASGGPFRAWDRQRVADATIDDALQHPTWRMGSKITIDSATLANKALEVIEAHHLFRLPFDRIDVVVHPQSIVHALVEFDDGSVLAQLGFPTMEIPILVALTWPERLPDTGTRRFDPVAAGALTFEPVRHEVFPAFGFGVEAGRRGGNYPAIFNAANEVAVDAFLAGRLRFGDIAGVIETVLAGATFDRAMTIEAIWHADRAARRRAEEAIR